LLMIIPLLWVASYYQLKDIMRLKKVYEAPQASFFIILSLLSLGGFPPLVGFFYKWIIFLGLLKSSKYLLCGFLIFFSLVSLFFYLRLCFNLYSLYWRELKLLRLRRAIAISGKEISWFFIRALIIIIVFGFTCLGPLWS
jgi:NADH:ubiquinone oxidoreductase subunit 2 (subunit N)